MDLCRSIARWCIFLDHILDDVCGWLTLRHFSDASEVSCSSPA
ncbi:OpgC domain-containing protein [Bradyrhizobium sp. JR3.5]